MPGVDGDERGKVQAWIWGRFTDWDRGRWGDRGAGEGAETWTQGAAWTSITPDACSVDNRLRRWDVEVGGDCRFRGASRRRHRMKIPQEADDKMNADTEGTDFENQEELEEKTRLINQVLELQHTLEDLSARVDAVKEENLKLKSENQVLGQYIENLMSASSVFQTTESKNKRK
ncbi:uncharacterized protein LOC129702188 isoform X1 [Leucoraja erinacea]|uniref:uncharacterized protein LOC129702188 isoform X1 n=2 Tax=Batoidea TaxID=117893 RepID=UPI0024550FBB|nr:uncharacterized protein LOC129702188 isoform X1 [Leucoraja erinacea]